MRGWSSTRGGDYTTNNTVYIVTSIEILYAVLGRISSVGNVAIRWFQPIPKYSSLD
jgi:hypothetical protein